MATITRPTAPTVEQLVKAAQKLTAEERRELLRRLAEGEGQNGGAWPDEVALREAAKARLPTAAERRLKRLVARSERGELTPEELTEYQNLAQSAQEIDARRAEALAELARLRPGWAEKSKASRKGEAGTDGP